MLESNPQKLLLDLIEKVTELSVVLNISKKDVKQRLVKSWQKSLKDFGDETQIPKEFGDVQIATVWLAKFLGIKAGRDLPGRETQEMVSSWCDEHYPGFDQKARLLDLVEETIELAAAMSADIEVIQQKFDHVWEVSSQYSAAEHALTQKIQNIELATAVLATHMEVDLADVLDTVMRQNRARNTAEFAARLNNKNIVFGNG